MSEEFADWAGWYAVLHYVYDGLFPPVFLELLEDFRCRLSRRDLKAIVSVKNLKTVTAALGQLDTGSHTEAVAQWLQRTNTTFAIVILEAIEAAIQRADYLEDSVPVPLNGWRAVHFYLGELLESV